MEKVKKYMCSLYF